MVNVLNVLLSVIVIVACLFMIVTVLLQESKTQGLGAAYGSSNSYFSKNKNSSMEAKLALGTKIAAAVFVVGALLMLLVNRFAA